VAVEKVQRKGRTVIADGPAADEIVLGGAM
jgi:hypothetical protein